MDPELFNTDVFEYVITRCLNGKDLMSLYYANLITEKKLYEYLVVIILDRLRYIFNTDYDKIINLIKDNKVGITGSFILEILTGEMYYGDIDFCCFKDSVENVKSFIKATNCKNINSWVERYRRRESKFQIKNDIIDSVIEAKYCYEIYIPAVTGENDVIISPEIIWGHPNSIDITNIVTTEASRTNKEEIIKYCCYRSDKGIVTDVIAEIDICKRKKILQFIFLKGGGVDKYLDTFDMDICQNLFYYEDNQFKLKIGNMMNIFNKEIKIKLVPSLEGRRLVKYINKRGFKVINGYDEKVIILKHILKMCYMINDWGPHPNVFIYNYDASKYRDVNVDCTECFCKILGLDHFHIMLNENFIKRKDIYLPDTEIVLI